MNDLFSIETVPMREISRPSTANCTLSMYISYILSEPKHLNCSRLGKLMNISHDSVTRFLNRENLTPEDLFLESSSQLDLKGGVLSVDDTVLDKPYSYQMELVDYFWSGKHHRSVKGINLITLYYTDLKGHNLPVNYRIYDKSEGKTKNDYFQEMLAEVLKWGIEPNLVTGDSWYSGVSNLKLIRKYQLGFLFALESNRTVSVKPGEFLQIQKLGIPEDGLEVWLRDFGYVKVFRTRLKDQPRHYAMYLPDNSQLITFDRNRFLKLHDQHWQIEQYHRIIKQVCHIEHFQVRSSTAIRNHIFASICSYVCLQYLRITDFIDNCYSLHRNLFNEVIINFIQKFMPNIKHLDSKIHQRISL